MKESPFVNEASRFADLELQPASVPQYVRGVIGVEHILKDKKQK